MGLLKTTTVVVACLAMGCGGGAVVDPTGSTPDSNEAVGISLQVSPDPHSTGGLGVRASVSIEVGPGWSLEEATLVMRDAQGAVVARAATSGPATDGRVTLVLEASPDALPGKTLDVNVRYKDASGTTHTFKRTIDIA